jgi:hypothetical protein
MQGIGNAARNSVCLAAIAMQKVRVRAAASGAKPAIHLHQQRAVVYGPLRCCESNRR